VRQSGSGVNHTLPRSALVLTPKAYGADGVSALTRLVASTLSGHGVDTRVLALETDARRDLNDGSMDVPVASAEGDKLRFVFNGMLAAPRARRPEFVIATHLRMLSAAVPLMASGVPVAAFLLGVECWRPLSRRDRGLLARCQLLLPISRFTWKRFLEVNPSFSHAEASLCPPGIDTPPAVPVAPVPGRVLVVGRLWAEERYKGHDLLIDVWPRVRRSCSNAQLVIAGDGDDRARLEERVRAAGLDHAVCFTGLLSQQDLRREFERAQVFALPSEGEGFGIVFLEAMRAARPCVAAQGAAEEIVIDGQTGRIVPGRDAESLATALVELIQNRGLCDALGAAGRRRLESEFSTQRFAERLNAAMAAACTPC
jgi:phosphatidylinositol alpha-1,6-mannosyltransferase